MIVWSKRPARAAFERFALFYSPIWIAAMATVMLTGVYRSWSDPVYMIFGVALAAPLVLWPALGMAASADEAQEPWWRRSWVRHNLWIAIFVFVGSYVCTHYFFDVAGMRYGFPTRWHLEAELVGERGEPVPLFLYFVTQAYFMTYHIGAVVALRTLSERLSLGPLGRAVVVVILAYAVAFAETFCMAVPILADVFEYADRGRMLAVGSIFYGSFFVVSVPVFARFDEDRAWSLGETAASSLAVSMVVVLVLDLWAKLIGGLS